jgi:hypothetical protein
MSNTVSTLEQQRASLLQQMPGSLHRQRLFRPHPNTRSAGILASTGAETTLQ